MEPLPILTVDSNKQSRRAICREDFIYPCQRQTLTRIGIPRNLPAVDSQFPEQIPWRWCLPHPTAGQPLKKATAQTNLNPPLEVKPTFRQSMQPILYAQAATCINVSSAVAIVTGWSWTEMPLRKALAVRVHMQVH